LDTNRQLPGQQPFTQSFQIILIAVTDLARYDLEEFLQSMGLTLRSVLTAAVLRGVTLTELG
jgi:hypothetical protein